MSIKSTRFMVCPRRKCAVSPTAEIVAALESCADELNRTALLIGEYATNFTGQAMTEWQGVMNKVKGAAKNSYYSITDIKMLEDAK